MFKITKPELLAPAGDMFKLNHALRYGADAVYFGLGGYNMRSGATAFTPADITQAVKTCHSFNKKAYLALNTVVKEGELLGLYEALTQISPPYPDAVIVSDLGVLQMVKALLKEVPIHISTQQSVSSALSALAFKGLGASRVVLARELGLKDIKEIVLHLGGAVQCEVFVQGAMCIAYSGRCLISSYLNGRSANSGACTQPCRWEYAALSLIEKQKGHSLEIVEQNGESFVLSSKDLCMIEHVRELMDCGVASFKIEGRMKSAYYTALTTKAFRTAIDLAFENKQYDSKKLLLELENVSHREYDTGFFYADPRVDAKTTKGSYIVKSQYIGSAIDAGAVKDDTALKEVKDGLVPFVLKNKVTENMAASLVRPKGDNAHFTIARLYDKDFNRVRAVNRPGEIFYIEPDTRIDIKPYDILITSVN